MEGWDPAAGTRLWDYIQEKMAESGVSLLGLERTSGVSRATVYAWKDGRRPRRDAGGRIAKALGTTYADLMQHRAGLLNGEYHPQPLPEDQIREIAERVAQLVVDRLARSDPERSE
jgi:transcriptional regulator with XRE-family HTH domain